jgi:hypothetical protein
MPEPKRTADSTFRRGVPGNPKGINGLPPTVSEKAEFRHTLHQALAGGPDAMRQLRCWIKDPTFTFYQKLAASIVCQPSSKRSSDGKVWI